jgi:lysophospholipase L1-like esterase
MPKVVLIAPPKIKEGFINKDWGFVGAQEISNNLAGEYKKFTEKHGWDFIDASNMDVDPTDGVHLDFEGNKRIGELVTAYLEKELN